MAAVLSRYANAVSLDPPKLFAKSVCAFSGKINGIAVNCMVNTGAKMSLMLSDIYNWLRLAMDTDGQQWSLHRILGSAVSLWGCVTNVPIKVAGKVFQTHVFVSLGSIGQNDVILGQPFLDWFLARMDYLRGTITNLTLFPNGQPSEYGVVIPIQSLDTCHNTDRLIYTAMANYHANNLELLGFGNWARD